MASFNRVTASGSTNLFSVPFPYLDQDHVHVSVDGEEVSAGQFTWSSPSQIALTAGNPEAGAVVETYRLTPVGAIVQFRAGNLDIGDLNVATLQALYLAEEARDRNNDLKDRAWLSPHYGPGGLITKGPSDRLPIFDALGNLGPSGTSLSVLLGLLSDAITGGGDAVFATALGLRDINVKAGINTIRTNGYYSAGDAGGWAYRLKAAPEADEPGQLLSNGDTLRWAIVPGFGLSAEVFGAGRAGFETVDDTDAFANALAFMALHPGNLQLLSPVYKVTSFPVVPDGVHLYGQGGGYIFEHTTKIIFTGTGSRSYSIAGATATTVANPSVGEAYLADSGTRGNTYTTLDLTVAFSAAIILGKGSGLHSIGFYPDLDGTDGYYVDSPDMAADWDVGVWLRNADAWSMSDCSFAGHWRKAACLVSSHDIGDGKVPSCEKGRAVHCFFQGFRGVAIRSPQTITGDNYGFAGTSFLDCRIGPLTHQSGYLATSSHLAAPLSSPSGCLEMSGGAMRGIQFIDTTFIGPDDICMIFDKASEIFFTGCYEEGQTVKVGAGVLTNGVGSRMVGTVNTSRIIFRNNAKFAVDFTPYQGRDVGLGSGRYTAAGVWVPLSSDDDDYSEQRFGSNLGPKLRSSAQSWRVVDQNDGVPMQMSNAGILSFGSTGGLLIPNVTAAQLASATDAINTTGKYLWKLVFNATTGILMRANGGTPTSTWKNMDATITVSPA
jgi:hypothetical protein